MPSNSASYWDRPNARFRPARPLALDPGTSFYGAGENAFMPSVIDFWRWGFSDLKDNTIRGIFGEFIVAKALAIPIKAIPTVAEVVQLLPVATEMIAQITTQAAKKIDGFKIWSP